MHTSNSKDNEVSVEDFDIAVLIPCYNEEVAIGKVVRSFQAELPHATIHVYDNNSDDNTSSVAREAGAVVGHESLAGKG